MEFEFDVFLSHNSRDKGAVRKLKALLSEHGLKSWLDADELRPGINWQPLLEAGIRKSKSIAVLIGADGLGPWEDEEMQAALRLAVKDQRPIIPVQLPGCSNRPDLPLFLGNRTWVELSGGYTEEAIGRLVWGITGKKPDQSAAQGNEKEKREPATPAELWPTPPAWNESSRMPDCYRRLAELCAAGEHPQSDERARLWQGVKQHRPDS
ncbi:MAG: toll/interleukin-1 receptor domain-containing protein, partial [Gammaproteobacteria bacterium]